MNRIAVISVIVVLFIVLAYISYKTRSDLAANGRLTNGIIIGEDRTTRGYLILIYEFNINGKKIVGTRDLVGLAVIAGHDFLGKTFPVIYDPKDLENNDILITPKGFEYYNRKFPDSLIWVKGYIKR